MSGTIATTQIALGDEVFGSDESKVGNVADVQADYIVVEKGFFFPSDYYVPRSAIASVGNGRVYLNVTKDVALHSGWETVPETSGISAAATEIDLRDATLAADRTVTDARTTGTTAAADEIHIPVVEEELTATVRAREAGAVRIEKDVVAEERVLAVPVTEERVRVERRAVDRPATAADLADFEDTVIDVPLMREEVELHKQARVAEEVVISKEAVQRTEQVRGTVRREEVIIDEDEVVDPAIVDSTGTGRTTTP
ncbi:MAG: DUF2382 domain-containing protein [Thermomicrobiales bacterium]